MTLTLEKEDAVSDLEQTPGWSEDEERVIEFIRVAEKVPRIEAIRRMQRRRKASHLARDKHEYAARLRDLWLLEFSIPVRDRNGWVLAVPIGGRRRGGFVSLRSGQDVEAAAGKLAGKAGFPNVRIEFSGSSDTGHVVCWGEEAPGFREGPVSVEREVAESRARGEFYGYSDSAIRAHLFECFDREALLAALRLCRNPECKHGQGGQPASLAHRRAGSRWCSDACRKQARRNGAVEVV